MSRFRRVAHLGQHQYRACYMIFDDFEILKSCMYYILKMYICIYSEKEHWWSLTSPWPDIAKEGLGQPGMFLKESYYPQTKLI